MTAKRRIAAYHKQSMLLVTLGALIASVASLGAIYLARIESTLTERVFLHGLGTSTVIFLLLLYRFCGAFTRVVREEIIQLERSEEEFRLANGALNAVFGASPVAIVVLDSNFCVTMWNRAAESLLGWSLEEVLGHELSTLLGPRAGAVCEALRLSEPEEQFYDRELEVISKTREKVDVSLSGAVMRHPDGEPWGYVVIMVDLSERKRARAALERQKSVEERDRLRSQLLAITAHELRNPMASIKGILSFMRWRISEGKPVRNFAQKLEVLEKEADRLAEILDEMLDAFSIQEGRLSGKSLPVDVYELLTSALQPFIEAHERRTFHLEGIEPGHVTVLGDFRRLEDVFRNLLSNAVKYSPPTSDIYVRVESGEGRVVVSVTDLGVGILSDDLPFIFDGFYRGNNLAYRDPGGLGLGLYICKGIVERHSGTISIESRPGGGTTCRVTLPVLSVGTPTHSPEPSLSEASCASASTASSSAGASGTASSPVRR